jgi:hypothetical protein
MAGVVACVIFSRLHFASQAPMTTLLLSPTRKHFRIGDKNDYCVLDGGRETVGLMQGQWRSVRFNAVVMQLRVRFGSKADVRDAPSHVSFTPNSDRKSGHVGQTQASFLPPESQHTGHLKMKLFGA